MPPTSTARRLSPKVRRLLAEHDLDARSIPGSGTAGRITPADVLAVAGAPRSAAGGVVAASPAARRLLRDAGHEVAAAAATSVGPVTRADAQRFLDEQSTTVLASPLARRLLRDAGIDLHDASRAADGARLTRADAEGIIADHATGTDDGAVDRVATPGRRASSRAAVEATVDVGLLLARLDAAGPATAARNGFGIPPVVAIAAALAGVLGANRDAWSAAAGGGGTDVSVALAWPDADEPVVVADAAVLTVPGLARRAHAASTDGPRGDARPTVVVAPEHAATGSLLTSPASLGVLTVDDAVPRRVSDTDEHGHPLVRTRPHVTLRLHHDDELTPSDARDVLDALTAVLVAWDRPVGP